MDLKERKGPGRRQIDLEREKWNCRRDCPVAARQKLIIRALFVFCVAILGFEYKNFEKIYEVGKKIVVIEKTVEHNFEIIKIVVDKVNKIEELNNKEKHHRGLDRGS